VKSSRAVLLLVVTWVGIFLVAGLAATAFLFRVHPHTNATPELTRKGALCTPRKDPHAPYLGIFVSDPKPRVIDSFVSATRTAPEMIGINVRFGAAFQESVICRIAKGGALPLIQINPRKISLAAIAHGDYDSYLDKYALAFAEFRLPVAISFGPEMNDEANPWGWHHVKPANYVAAWRHVHDAFTRAGAKNVTWVWTIDRYSQQAQVAPAQPWWPGASYVDWVGVAGRYATSTSDFSTVYGPTLTAIGSFAKKPVLLTQAGIAANLNRPQQIKNLFRAAAHNGQIVGVVWSVAAAGHASWTLNGDPASDVAFRRGAKELK
jgi:hypothetical protein